MSTSHTWGTEPSERSLEFPCDAYVKNSNAVYFRGITVNADTRIVYRWLCQMRVAPYSYDILDNLGRRSPQSLTPGLEKLEKGQRVMFIFELVEFDPGRHLTIGLNPDGLLATVFGESVMSYMLVPLSPESCRLLVKLVFRYPRGPVGWFMRLFLPWGDLIMMRRQLLNFKKLSEKNG